VAGGWAGRIRTSGGAAFAPEVVGPARRSCRGVSGARSAAKRTPMGPHGGCDRRLLGNQEAADGRDQAFKCAGSYHSPAWPACGASGGLPARTRGCAPSMGIDYRVKVPEGGDRTDLSEAQGHNREGVSGGSVEREEWADEQEPDTRRRRPGRVASHPRSSCDQGRRRRSGGHAPTADVLTWGDLALRLKGRRREGGARSQQRP
jgi:hypothetical protein